MYAIVRTGGKQYRVEEGRGVSVERLRAEEGATVELGDVLLIADDGQVTVGTPTIEGARVLAQVEAHGRAKKIIVFKYKAKVRTRKKTGHRQAFTQLAVREILRPGQQPKEAEKPTRRRRKKAEPVEEAPTAGAKVPTTKRPTRRAATAGAEAPTTKRRTARAATAGAKAPTTKRRTARAPTAGAKAPTTKRRTARAAAGSAEATTGGGTKRKTGRARAEGRPRAAARPTPSGRRRSTGRKKREETE